jgi:hypothetical protein
MQVVMLSLWRNDAQRAIKSRLQHLLAKGASAYIWVTGDNVDDTEHILSTSAHCQKEIIVLRKDTHIHSSVPDDRLRGLSQSAQAGLDYFVDHYAQADYLLIHESDLISPPNLIERMIALSQSKNGAAVAGWVTLQLGSEKLFYDTWAYRKDGVKFTNHAPFHASYDAETPFEVDSVGSCVLFPAHPLRDGWRLTQGGIVEICQKMQAAGVHIWVDPTLEIIQPVALWSAASHANF